jgi:hypothetical protein
LGQFLQRERGFIHIEFDNAGVPPDLVEQAGLKQEWEALYLRSDPSLLVSRFPQPTVITIPGFPIFDRTRPPMDGIKVRYLVGPAWACLREFEKREQELNRKLGASHWLHNNTRIFYSLEQGTIPAEWCVPAFNANGNRRTFDEIANDVCA